MAAMMVVVLGARVRARRAAVSSRSWPGLVNRRRKPFRIPDAAGPAVRVPSAPGSSPVRGSVAVLPVPVRVQEGGGGGAGVGRGGQGHGTRGGGVDVTRGARARPR